MDSFSVLFRPKDITFQKWDHMAFSGWTRDNFLNADSLYPALDAFEHWLQPEDILCWWHQEAYALYTMFTKVAQIRDRASKVVFLSDYIYGFLAGQKGAVGSPYKICAARDITTPELHTVPSMMFWRYRLSFKASISSKEICRRHPRSG